MSNKLRLYPMVRPDTEMVFVSPKLFKPMDMVVTDSVYDEPFKTSFLKPGVINGLFTLCIPRGEHQARCTDEILAEDLIINQLMFKYTTKEGGEQFVTTSGFAIRMSEGKSSRDIYTVKGTLNIYDYINTLKLDGSGFQIPRGGIDLPLHITYNKNIATLDFKGDPTEITTGPTPYLVELLGITFTASYEKTGVNKFTHDV